MWRFTPQQHWLWVFFLFFKVTLSYCEHWLQTVKSAKPDRKCWAVTECKEMRGVQRGSERENPLTKAASHLQGRPTLPGNQELAPIWPASFSHWREKPTGGSTSFPLHPSLSKRWPNWGHSHRHKTAAAEVTLQPFPGTVFARGLKGIFYFILQRCPFCWQK